jgi:hypothetical protein
MSKNARNLLDVLVIWAMTLGVSWMTAQDFYEHHPYGLHLTVSVILIVWAILALVEYFDLADSSFKRRDIMTLLADEQLSRNVACNCCDPHHSSRFCATCEARFAAIQDYKSKLISLLEMCEGCGRDVEDCRCGVTWSHSHDA